MQSQPDPQEASAEEQPPKQPSLLWAVLRGAVGGIVIGGAFIGGYLFRAHEQPSFSTDDSRYGMLSEAESLLQQHYLYDIPAEEALIQGAVGGMVTSLGDPFTYYVPPARAELDSTELAGTFGGIGAQLSVDEQGRFVIVDVYPDNPAAEAGILAGDIIWAVDGVRFNAEDDPMDNLLAAIRGEVGTDVSITVLRGEERLTFELTRAELTLPVTEWRLLEEDPQVGYIRLARFTERSPEEVEEAIRELKREGAQAFILDLRNNGGGLVNAAVDIADIFLDGGPVLIEERVGERPQTENARRGGSATDEPLVVLVNSGTASAAEIVAGAFQDLGRAQLVGQQTFGKGSVQVILTLQDGSSLHITTARWLTPDNQPLDGQGLTPDRITEPSAETDAELQAALELLNEGLQVAEGEE